MIIMGLDQWLNKNGENVITWRKCNQIHGYFNKLFNGIDNLSEETVTIENIKELHSLCEKVLNEHNEESSKMFLPVMKGCFFGCYEYNDYYYEDVEWTRERLGELINNHCSGDYYTYQAWW